MRIESTGVKCQYIFQGLQNKAIRELQIRAGFRDYKSGQERLQIGVAEEISNRGNKITNRSRDFKSGQRDFKQGQRLQIGAEHMPLIVGSWKSHFKYLNLNVPGSKRDVAPIQL